MSDFLQWYNENQNRNYPFKEGVSLVSTANGRLPDSFIVDMHLTIPSDYSTGIHCSYVRITPNTISLGIASSTAGLFTCTFSTSAVKPYTAYSLTPLIANVSGWVVFGSYSTSELEVYQFNSASSLLDARTLNIMSPAPVTKLSKLGDSTSRYVTGLVRLRNGPDIKFFQHETDEHTIVAELQNPVSYIGPCNPLIDVTADRTTLHSINGVTPDSNGVLTIRFEG